MEGVATSGLIVLLAIGIVFVAASVYGRIAGLSWERTPYPPGKLVSAGDTRLYVRVKGEGGPVIIIEPALGSPGAEWWHIQDELAKTTTVVTYDRAGYGWSKKGKLPRTSAQVASELLDLLQSAELSGPYILVGHSQGGLYLQVFGRLHPEMVAGAVFLDPVSSDDQRFKAELKPDVYRGSGIDKLATINSLNTLRQLGLMRVFRNSLYKKLMCNYEDLSPTTREVIWQHFTLPKSHAAMLNEYQQNATAANSSEVRAAGTFPHVPLKVIYHSPRKMVREMMQYGMLQREDADEVELIWEQLVRAYLRLSPHSEWIVAQDTGHFIHLERPELVLSEVREMIETVRSGSAQATELGT